MKFGLSSSQYEILERLLISPLKDKNAKVYIFGSRARGKHHPFSDIDVLYKEDPNQPIPASEISLIKEALEESRLTVKVDLVNEDHLAASYRPSVMTERVSV